MTALPSLSAHLLPPLMARYKAAYPGIQIELFDLIPERGLELVRQRRVDFALTGVGLGLAGLQSQLLFKEKFFLVCPQAHKLARLKTIRLAQLAGYEFIRLVRNGSIARHLAHALNNVQVQDSGLEVEQISTLAGLVSNGLGISVVPQAAVTYFDPTLVAVIPISDPRLTRSIYAVWPSTSVFTPAATGFLELLKNTLPKLRPA